MTLTSAVWADQRERHARLRAALDLASRVPVVVDRASLDEWTRRRLAVLPRGVATVVHHSVVAEDLDDATRTRFAAAITAAGARATAERPLAWVRLEPISGLRHHGVQLTRWPGGDTIALARCGAHGTDVEWLGGVNGGPQG